MSPAAGPTPSAPPHPDTEPVTGPLLSAWVCRGVANFFDASGIDSAVASALPQATSGDALFDRLADDWHGLNRWMAGRAQPLAEPLGTMVSAFELNQAETFVVALLSELEQSHLLNLAIAELQAPSGQPRPTLHLLAAITRTLFPETGIDCRRLANHPLLSAGVLRCDGDGPQPLRTLAIDYPLWSAARGDTAPRLGVTPLPPPDPGLQTASLLQMLTGVEPHPGIHFRLRGDIDECRFHFASLASRWQTRAVLVPLESWLNDPATATLCRLRGWVPLIEVETTDTVLRLLRSPTYTGPVFITTLRETRLEAPGLTELGIPAPDDREREALWRDRLEQHAVAARPLLHARLGALKIARIAAQARQLSALEQQPPRTHHLRRAWNLLSLESLGELADPVAQDVGPDALVLPQAIHDRLAGLVLRCRRREQLWQGLGVTAASSRNFGLRALFTGDSGTGKTLAASYLATALGMPLFRVDVSAVLDKYVGESEKNLSRLFERADALDVMLLLDEADALFGRRSDGNDPGARFANMLTNFLLTRIESYAGIVILTSNSLARIDPAFARRLDSVIDFPSPGYDERLRLWGSHLGDRSPDDETLRRLSSHCELSGGAIRNAVLMAASRGWTISALDLLEGLAVEYHKLGKTMPTTLQNWRDAAIRRQEAQHGDA